MLGAYVFIAAFSPARAAALFLALLTIHCARRRWALHAQSFSIGFKIVALTGVGSAAEKE